MNCKIRTGLYDKFLYFLKRKNRIRLVSDNWVTKPLEKLTTEIYSVSYLNNVRPMLRQAFVHANLNPRIYFTSEEWPFLFHIVRISVHKDEKKEGESRPDPLKYGDGLNEMHIPGRPDFFFFSMNRNSQKRSAMYISKPFYSFIFRASLFSPRFLLTRVSSECIFFGIIKISLAS